MKRHASAPSGRPEFPIATSITLAIVAVLLLPSDAAAQGPRGASLAHRQGLVLEGAPVLARTVEGGEAYGELVSVPGPDVVKKHVGQVKYSDIVVEAGDDDAMRQWIAQSWSGNASPRNGAIVTTDFNYKSIGERQFMNAMITETTIPTLDGSSKDPAYIGVKLTPQAVVVRKGTGNDMRAMVGGPKQRMWLRSNFRFELGDLPSSRVARIDSFTVRSAVTGGSGEVRMPKHAGAVQFPNLRLSISQADYQAWADWRDRFLTQGENGDNAEKKGAIVFLTPNMRDEIARVTLSNCGILSLRQPAAAELEKVARFEVELYCEQMAMESKP